MMRYAAPVGKDRHHGSHKSLRHRIRRSFNSESSAGRMKVIIDEVRWHYCPCPHLFRRTVARGSDVLFGDWNRWSFIFLFPPPSTAVITWAGCWLQGWELTQSLTGLLTCKSRGLTSRVSSPCSLSLPTYLHKTAAPLRTNVYFTPGVFTSALNHRFSRGVVVRHVEDNQATLSITVRLIREEVQ